MTDRFTKKKGQRQTETQQQSDTEAALRIERQSKTVRQRDSSEILGQGK